MVAEMDARVNLNSRGIIG